MQLTGDVFFLFIFLLYLLHIVMIFAGLATIYFAIRIRSPFIDDFLEGLTGVPKNVWFFCVIFYWTGWGLAYYTYGYY